MSAREVPDGLMVSGLRTRRSFGMGNLSKEATIGAALVLAADGLIGIRHPASLLVTLPLTGAVVGLAAVRRHGMSALAYYRARLAWWRAHRAGATSYRRVLLPQPFSLDLPGVAASSSLIAAHDPTTGRKVGVVHDRSTGRMTVSTLLAPGGSLMAHTGAVRSGLRTWGEVLNTMATAEQIKGASVTIQITPGAGEALADDVRTRRRPDAPRLALDTIDELVRTTPQKVLGNRVITRS
ncbi:SCO6880 family protein [Kitasatospora sp. NPDC058063]|uniref:SCO6880 family protein n=1 Tax=unclassified Kitasatospora TaxID=2633591 RepID=UPI0036DD5B2D